ncbi:nucleotidyltransferase domain-containing protein [Mesobacillus subterraneus]|uniref:Nucleotidyltransferase domain-containing protein n=1 Tax=Mesobacillus subterraneus TaxID=285983 RepID=A0A427TM07_9BACI|nr:nucleotidyltransferase domain-containing protein [Mesobacillus subterraneus]RSD25382.1 nucleotidyltransferase domain-containing protein [Mesobacillus subterraneus]
MKEHISSVLRQIEQEFNVKILHACEAGSRALGFHSQKSDYDIRFIYLHNLEWYLSIDQGRDVIEIPRHDTISIHVDPLLDVSGWELRKALRLFRKSNPSLLEWLHSSIVYKDDFGIAEKMRALEKEVFSVKPYFYHHLNLAKSNFKNQSKSDDADLKPYLYMVRSVLAAKWAAAHRNIPPVNLNDLLRSLPDSPVKTEAMNILAIKKSGNSISQVKNSILHEYIKSELVQMESYGKHLSENTSDHTESLNSLFQLALEHVWDPEILVNQNKEPDCT